MARAGPRSSWRCRCPGLPLPGDPYFEAAPGRAIMTSLAFSKLGLRCVVLLPLSGEQPVGDVVLVDVADVGDRLPANPLRRDALDTAEPDIGIEAPLRRLAAQLPQAVGAGVVGGERHQNFVQRGHGF